MLKATEKELFHVVNAQVRFQATSGGRLVIMLVGHKRKTRFYATTRLKNKTLIQQQQKSTHKNQNKNKIKIQKKSSLNL